MDLYLVNKDKGFSVAVKGLGLYAEKLSLNPEKHGRYPP